MIKKIFKYKLEIDSIEHIIAPVGKVVHFGFQHDGLYMWIEHVKDACDSAFTYLVVGTGWEFDSTNLEHFMTTMTSDGLVFHLYLKKCIYHE